jgi:8-oxo-dGTP pyrophosphatase MutT (NUDIX family)
MELQVGVKILMKNEKGKYLVLLRSAIKYPDAGEQWEIVGGRIDPGSPLLENLKREVKEETGLEITGKPKLIAAQDILKSTKHIVRLTYIGEGSGDVVLSDEHTDFKWLSLEDIKKLDPIDGYLTEVLKTL